MKSFELGQVVATPPALAAMERTGDTPVPFLSRHAAGDWGTVGRDDWKANDRALLEGSRIFSAYKLKDGTKIWIMTTATDENGRRESTCIMLPSDY